MLKQLILESQIKEKRKALEGYQEKRNDIEKQILKLRESLEEAKTEEEISFVREEITKLEGENEELNLTEKINNVENEIKALEEELSDIEERTKTKEDKKEPEKVRSEEMNRLQVRELIKNGGYYERAEVKEFYNKIKNFRAVGGEGLTIPNIVVNRIMDILGDYSTIYPLVDKISVQGTARILLDTDTEPATWIEMAGAIPTGDVGTIINVDFDGFKVGKATFIDNCMLQDSIINLDSYVTKKIARSLALALDKAILLGEGSASKQPVGIITDLPSGQKVTKEKIFKYATYILIIIVVVLLISNLVKSSQINNLQKEMEQLKLKINDTYENKYKESKTEISTSQDESQTQTTTEITIATTKVTTTTTSIPIVQYSPTIGERNAVGSAKNYIRMMGFSYSRLVEQLEYEGYSTVEAEYGADNCGANWNEECAESAENYLSIMPYSRQELQDQLEYEGYSSSQISYALAAVGY